jgi:hypothetical protein
MSGLMGDQETFCANASVSFGAQSWRSDVPKDRLGRMRVRQQSFQSSAGKYCHNIDEITRGDFLTPPALACLNRVAITTTLQSLEKQRPLSQIY